LPDAVGPSIAITGTVCVDGAASVAPKDRAGA